MSRNVDSGPASADDVGRGTPPVATPAGRRTGRVGDWDETRRARALLSWLAEPGFRPLGRLVRADGPVETLRRVVTDRVPAEVRDAVCSRLAAVDLPRLGDRLEADTRRLGCRLVTPEDDDWPSPVDDLARMHAAPTDRHVDPPLALWARGELPLADTTRRAVAVVGARAATAYGNHVATDLAYGLADRGWTVVSGGAAGVDGAAHRGCLATGLPTVAVLACGVDVVYPMAHAGLFERIGQQGLVLSEWPPGATAQRHRFLIRNRVIAALCRGTVVVEASARSGTRNTARRTIQLGRLLMAVPGPVTSGMSVGTHLLIRADDARLVTSAAEIIEEVGRIGEDLAPLPRGATDRRDALDESAARVLDAVPLRRPASVQDIAVEAGVPAVQVRRSLPMLCLLGLVEETVTGYRIAPASRPGAPG